MTPTQRAFAKTRIVFSTKNMLLLETDMNTLNNFGRSEIFFLLNPVHPCPPDSPPDLPTSLCHCHKGSTTNHLGVSGIQSSGPDFCKRNFFSATLRTKLLIFKNFGLNFYTPLNFVLKNLPPPPIPPPPSHKL